MRRWILGFCLLPLLTGCLGSQNRPLEWLSRVDPSYPEEAFEQGVEGFVVVRYDVTTSGTVANAQVVEAEPEGVFEDAALQAVGSWVFKPAIRNGEPQAEQGRLSRLTFTRGAGDEYSQY